MNLKVLEGGQVAKKAAKRVDPGLKATTGTAPKAKEGPRLCVVCGKRPCAPPFRGVYEGPEVTWDACDDPRCNMAEHRRIMRNCGKQRHTNRIEEIVKRLSPRLGSPEKIDKARQTLGRASRFDLVRWEDRLKIPVTDEERAMAEAESGEEE